ncbi:MAG: ferrous iron transport protein A [Candidatus Aminicenantes bacterium]|nr:ferrous iron transport protein A [Candidatus Aminicenantes bacterium]
MNPLDPDARGKILRIVDISGGENVRRRLFAMGFQPGDRVESGPRGILGGPVVLKNLRTGVAMAVGRGIARKIVVAVDA